MSGAFGLTPAPMDPTQVTAAQLAAHMTLAALGFRASQQFVTNFSWSIGRVNAPHVTVPTVTAREAFQIQRAAERNMRPVIAPPPLPPSPHRMMGPISMIDVEMDEDIDIDVPTNHGLTPEDIAIATEAEHGLAEEAVSTPSVPGIASAFSIGLGLSPGFTAGWTDTTGLTANDPGQAGIGNSGSTPGGGPGGTGTSGGSGPGGSPGPGESGTGTGENP
jgi:hypothetical protein